ncbi:MAG: SLC13 family permease [Thermodesulfobacteriota bacterium]
MTDQSEAGTGQERPVILLVDDEDHFRNAMNRRLSSRGYRVYDAGSGAAAVRIARRRKPEVVVLDRNLPDMDDIQVLREIRRVCPESPIILITGQDLMETDRHNAFACMSKPCGINELVDTIEAARQERVFAMARRETPPDRRHGLGRWLAGVHNARPGVMILGALLLLVFALMPAPDRMHRLLAAVKGPGGDPAMTAYVYYGIMGPNETIAGRSLMQAAFSPGTTSVPDSDAKATDRAVFRAKVMTGILAATVLFWATGALPIGITALLIGMLMCFFRILPPEQIAGAYAGDVVLFLFGVMAMTVAVMKTGLDKHIGALLLGTGGGIGRLAFVFCPLLAIAASFLPEYALVAFLVPVVTAACLDIPRPDGTRGDRRLAVMMILMITFAVNAGGPGSPAAGGRNALMLDFLTEYGVPLSFDRWILYGLPFVPVMGLVIGAYFYFMFRHRIKDTTANLPAAIRQATGKIERLSRDGYVTAAVLAGLVVFWTLAGGTYGLGGPAVLALVILNLAGVLRWRDINRINWDVIAIYAGACAMGTGLASTGAALWLADGFFGILPESFRSGQGLAVASSLLAGLLANVISDGAAVAALGPVFVPMAALSGTHPGMIGLAVAFAASFAHVLVVGSPNNAIAYGMARDPETGRQLLTMKDFLVHGGAVLGLSFLVLWGWAFRGYWRWIGF